MGRIKGLPEPCGKCANRYLDDCEPCGPPSWEGFTPASPVPSDESRLNHREALELAYCKRKDSNLARCYIELAEMQSRFVATIPPEPSGLWACWAEVWEEEEMPLFSSEGPKSPAAGLICIQLPASMTAREIAQLTVGDCRRMKEAMNG